jgi:hypothetical protein
MSRLGVEVIIGQVVCPMFMHSKDVSSPECMPKLINLHLHSCEDSHCIMQELRMTYFANAKCYHDNDFVVNKWETSA